MIKLKNVSVGYRHKTLISNINLSLFPGRKIIFTGTEKCGKTALLKTISGQIPPLYGCIVKIQNINLCFIPQDIFPENKIAKIKEVVFQKYDYIIIDEPFSFLTCSEMKQLKKLFKNFDGGLVISQTTHAPLYIQGFENYPLYEKTASANENAVYM